MTTQEQAAARRAAIALLERAGIAATDREKTSMEIVDFGLNDFPHEGLAIIVCANTDRYCGKELIMLPRQICPEHRHPPIPLGAGKTDLGKMETFRCRFGEVTLYVEGAPLGQAAKTLPASSAPHYTVGRAIHLKPGDQYTIPPNSLHWFQAGESGAIITEFSSTSRDEFDVFTHPGIRRIE